MKWLLNMKVTTKLLLLVIPLFATMIGLVFLFAGETNRVKDESQQALYEEAFVSSSLILNADRDFYQAALAEMEIHDHIQIGMDAEEKDRLLADYEDNVSQVLERVSSAIENISGNEELYSAYAHEASGMTLEQLGKSLIAGIAEWENIYDAKTNTGDMDAKMVAFEAEREKINEMTEILDGYAQSRSDEIAQTVEASITVSLIVCAAIILLLSALALYVIKTIKGGIRYVTDVSRRISQGELDVNIDDKKLTKDEIGQLTSMLDKDIRQAFKDIKQAEIIANKQSEYQAEQVDNLIVNLERLSQGELYCDMEVTEADEDTREIHDLFVKISDYLHETVNTVKELDEQVDQFKRNITLGKLDFRSDTDTFIGAYKKIMQSFNDTVSMIVEKLELIPSPLMFMDKDLKFTYMNETSEKLLGKSREELYGTKCANAWKTEACNTPECPCARSMKQDEVTFSENTCTMNGKHMDLACIGAPVKDENGEMVGSFEFVTDQTVIKDAMRVSVKQSEYQKTEVNKLVHNLQNLSDGNLSCDMVVNEPDEDTKDLYALFTGISDNLHKSVKTIKGYIDEISYTLGEVSSGNLLVEITSEYQGDFITLKNSINTILDSLSGMLQDINTSAEQVATGTKQVSDGSQEISQGATEQAASIEELSASITQITEQVKENTTNANKSSEVATNAKAAADDSNEKMKSMLVSMQDINESSANISKIIKVIDDIAFQTNILALNAAVEAARAGTHGKGFAVVAEEVRNLATRSAEAARETTVLIEGSINKVEAGTQIANETAKALQSIVEGATESVELSDGIAKASEEQSIGIAQVNIGIEQLSEVVQANSSTAEQSAAASEELSGQAEMLQSMIGDFKFKGRSQAADWQEDEVKEDKPQKIKVVEKTNAPNDNEFGKY